MGIASTTTTSRGDRTSIGAQGGHRSARDRRRRDRRGATRFVLAERRSGRERRADLRRRYLVPEQLDEWLRTHAWSVPVLLVLANLLSLADIALTLRVLEVGAVEANPLIGWLLAFDIRVAVGVKVVLVGAASLLIWLYRGHRRIAPLALLTTTVFASVVIYQTVMLLAVGGASWG